MKRRLIFVGFMASLCLGSVATTVIPMTVEQLAERSSHVVEAHATKNWSAWNPQHTMITTYTEFAVDDWLKGSGQSVITVMQPGGSAEGYTQHVAGVHGWSSGESAVLFLQPAAAHDGTFTVSGLMQGNFRVRHLASGVAIADNGIASSAKQVSNEDVQSFHRDDKSVAPYAGTRMDLTELERRVRSATRRR